jgi:inorganic pyrophosphatase
MENKEKNENNENKENKVNVYIEIEKGSNIKYEYDKDKKELVIDRILDAPFVYPYSYGFIPNTLAKDNDELDVLIITDKPISNNSFYDVYIIGALVMEDEKGMDEKIITVLEEDYETIKDIDDLDEKKKDNIFTFFSEYKKKSIGKWSKVIGYINKDLSIQLYKNSLLV